MSWERIDRYRVKTGKTLAEAAEKIGVGVSMLMMVKTGKRDLSSKALYRLHIAEVEAGISKAGPMMKEDPGHYAAGDQAKEMRRDLREVKKELAAIDRRVDDMLKRLEGK